MVRIAHIITGLGTGGAETMLYQGETWRGLPPAGGTIQIELSDPIGVSAWPGFKGTKTHAASSRSFSPVLRVTNGPSISNSVYRAVLIGEL